MKTVGEEILDLIDEWFEALQRFELFYYGETET
jgi:hypothetical protein